MFLFKILFGEINEQRNRQKQGNRQTDRQTDDLEERKRRCKRKDIETYTLLTRDGDGGKR